MKNKSGNFFYILAIILLTSVHGNSQCDDPLCVECSRDGNFCGRCVDGYYPNSSGICVRCDTGCEICPNAFFCDKCSTGYELSSDRRECSESGASFLIWVALAIVVIAIGVFLLVSWLCKKKFNRRSQRSGRNSRSNRNNHNRQAYNPQSVNYPTAAPANNRDSARDGLPPLEEIIIPQLPVKILGNNLVKHWAGGMRNSGFKELSEKCSMIGVLDFGPDEVDLEMNGMLESLYLQVNAMNSSDIKSFEIVEVPHQHVPRKPLWFFINPSDKKSCKDTNKRLGGRGSKGYPRFWVYKCESKRFVSKKGIEDLTRNGDRAYGNWLESI